MRHKRPCPAESILGKDQGKAGGLFGERLGNRSRRCPTSCIHAVVKGASNTVIRLKAAHITPSPFQGEGGDGGAMREHGHAHRHCTPTPALPPSGGGRPISPRVTGA